MNGTLDEKLLARLEGLSAGLADRAPAFAPPAAPPAGAVSAGRGGGGGGLAAFREAVGRLDDSVRRLAAGVGGLAGHAKDGAAGGRGGTGPAGPGGRAGDGLAGGLTRAAGALAAFLRHATDAAGALAGFRDSASRLQGAVASLAAKAAGAAASRVGAAARAVGRFVPERAKKAIGRAAGNAGSALRSAGLAGRAGARAAGGLARAGKAAYGAGAAAFGAATGGVAAFGAAAQKAASYVEAFAPSTVLVFQDALRDLTAVIGSALEPAIQAATSIVRDFSATLLPVMQRLRPVMEQAAGALKQVAGTAVNALGVAMNALAPALQLAADLFTALAPALQAAAAIFAGLVEAVSAVAKAVLGAFGVDASSVQSGFQKLAQYAVLAAAGLAKLLNSTLGDGFIRGVRGALTGDGVKKQSAAGTAAMTNARYSGFSDLGRQAALASAVASGEAGSQGKKPEDWLSEIDGTLKQMQSMTTQQMWEQIGTWIAAGMAKLPAKAYDAASAAVQQTAFGWAFSNPGAVAREVFGRGSLWR